METPMTSTARAALLRWVASAGLLAAAFVHALAVSPHYDHWRLAGIFFALLAAGEAALAAMLAAGPKRSVAAAAVALNAGTVALWAVSRTAGVPFGPEAGHAEITGTADILATSLEVASLLATIPLLVGSPVPALRPRLTHQLLGGALTGLLLVATGVAAAPSLGSHGHDEGAAGHIHAAELAAATLAAPAPSASAEVIPGMTYLDVHGHVVAGNPAHGALVGHPPVDSGSSNACGAPAHPGDHAESEVEMTAAAMRFERDELRLVQGLNVVTFVNRDRVPHNITVFDAAEPGCELFEGDTIFGGASTEYRITVPEAGEYRFRCDLHPNMGGTVTVGHHR